MWIFFLECSDKLLLLSELGTVLPLGTVMGLWDNLFNTDDRH
jgi:hypothetical protein